MLFSVLRIPAFPQLSNLPRDSRDTLFLLLVTGWVLLPQVSHVPLWCSALAACVLVWRGWQALRSQPLPSSWLVLALLAMTVGATVLSHQTLLGREAGVTMLVVLLTLKTLELRARRDAFVVFFLAFFCMLSNFFHSQSLLTAFSMLVGLMGLLTVLVNAHMPVGRPPLSASLRIAGWMTLLGAPIMLVLFLLFPRMAPLWGTHTDSSMGRSGLSPNMQVGTIARLALDDSVALRIKFEGATPPQSALYFRGPVLSSFDGREWRSPRASFSARYGVKNRLQVAGAPTRYEVTMEASSRPWLVVMDAVAQAPTVPGHETAMQEDLQWLTARPITELVRYQVTGFTEFRHGPTTRVPGLDEFTDLPPGNNPRTLALAAQIKSAAGNASASTSQLVEQVMTRLRTGGYVYTLEPGEYGANTADEFFFDRKEGFCEHIASSFVVLMRAMDIPARIVTGYQGGELNGVDGLWTVRQSDAHAWTEVWEEGTGWIRVDPTSAVSPGRTGAFQRLKAPQGVVGQALFNLSPGLAGQLRANWEALNHGWNQWVLNYTQGKQLNLLKDVGFDAPSWHDLGYLLIGIVVAASLVGATWTLWERTHTDPWLRLLGKARYRLAKLGIDSTTATSPRQLAALVEARQGSLNPASHPSASALHAWLLQLELQRYAPSSADHTRRQQLQRLHRQFKQLVWRL